MRRQALRVSFKVEPSDSLVRLRIGQDVWVLTPGEALHLADALVDAAEVSGAHPSVESGRKTREKGAEGSNFIEGTPIHDSSAASHALLPPDIESFQELTTARSGPHDQKEIS